MRLATFTAALALIGAGTASAADPASIDWSAVPKSELTLLYPGVASWEWLNSAAHKAGAPAVAEGKNCKECHAGEEKDIGDVIASGKKLEPEPLPNKPGTAQLTVQAAFDTEYLYLRANWPDDGKPGVFYRLRALKGGKWEVHGNMRGDAPIRKGEQPAVYEDRLSLMIGDKGVPEFTSAGCFATCHNDMRYMPNKPTKEEVQAHPYWGKDVRKKNDIRKYFSGYSAAPDATGGWKNPKSKEEIAALMGKGYFVDLLQWRAHRTNPTGFGDDGHVAEYRNFDKGNKNFVDNWDAEKKQPKWMFDPAKNGGKAVLGIDDLFTPANMLTDANSVPFDPAVAKDGAALPNWLVTTKLDGSYADIDFAKGTHDGKGWTVLMRRKLNTGNKDDVQLTAGQVYTIGFAIHDDETTARFHHVSFPMTLSLGAGNGDVNAVALK